MRGVCATVVPGQISTTCSNWNTRESHFIYANTPIHCIPKHCTHNIYWGGGIGQTPYRCTHINDNPSLLFVSKHIAEIEMESKSLRVQRVRQTLCKLLIHQDTGVFGSVAPIPLACDPLKTKLKSDFNVWSIKVLWTSCRQNLWADQPSQTLLVCLIWFIFKGFDRWKFYCIP